MRRPARVFTKKGPVPIRMVLQAPDGCSCMTYPAGLPKRKSLTLRTLVPVSRQQTVCASSCTMTPGNVRMVNGLVLSHCPRILSRPGQA